jgi:hypothetical protein
MQRWKNRDNISSEEFDGKLTGKEDQQHRDNGMEILEA